MPSLEVYVKVRKWGQNVLLAICDADILGKTFRDGGIVFEVEEEFYKGVKTSIEEAITLMDHATIVNLVGCGIVEKAVEKGYVHSDAVLKICGTMHAQIIKM